MINACGPCYLNELMISLYVVHNRNNVECNHLFIVYTIVFASECNVSICEIVCFQYIRVRVLTNHISSPFAFGGQ